MSGRVTSGRKCCTPIACCSCISCVSCFCLHLPQASCCSGICCFAAVTLRTLFTSDHIVGNVASYRNVFIIIIIIIINFNTLGTVAVCNNDRLGIKKDHRKN